MVSENEREIRTKSSTYFKHFMSQELSFFIQFLLTLHGLQTSPHFLGHLECLHLCKQALLQGGQTSLQGT